ncbi:Fc receptor-like protein 5 [Sparus aurata]|uniref:Fc receptor-like protein 5 n=1 Tax=Sparus aurata TaxID=8175 RepID=UPI0011C16E2B|nr:Fc receptor-like protein 5 [Sparus aurata]
MDITALCTRQLIDVLVLLVAQIGHSYSAQKADEAFPSVSPNRLQFFEYENFTVNCEVFTGLTEWRVMRNLQTPITPAVSHTWNSSAPSCSIYPSYKRHSGEYWCEDAEGRTSRAVNITVTDGSVILDVPARPVVQGHDVVLHCLKEKSESEHSADFYKDGSHLGTWYKGEAMTIQNVSMSDDGLYRCEISGAGESPESRLAVLKGYEETPPSSSPSSNLLSLLWIVVWVLLGGLLLLVMGLLLCRKQKVLICFSSGKPTPGSRSHEHHTGENSVVTYAFVKKQGKKGADSVDYPQHATYALVQKGTF